MLRKSRMYLPGIPAHVVQCGNNRQLCFYAAEDYRFYEEMEAALGRHLGYVHPGTPKRGG